MKPYYIILHHSLTKDSSTVSWSAIRKFHTETNHWRDIGYHYGIELVNDRYEILKGRMDDEVGAHARKFNHKSLGICCIGNFDDSPMPLKQYKFLVKLIRGLQRIFDIPRGRVIGHWETYKFLGLPIQKTCPGKTFNLDIFRREIT